jgi:hypothetical protein
VKTKELEIWGAGFRGGVREYFNLAVLPAPGGERDRVLALEGYNFLESLDSVKEWLPGPGGTTGWKQVTRLQEERLSYGAGPHPVLSEAGQCNALYCLET